MSGIYIPGVEMPQDENETIIRIQPDGTVLDQYGHHLAVTAVPVPAADVAPVRHGRWINHGWTTVCSVCGEDYAFAKRNYCPNCGAKMDLTIN